MAEAKSYEPVGGADDLEIEAFVRAESTGNAMLRIGGEANPWPYSTENTSEQAFLDAHSLVKEQGAPDPEEAEAEAEAEAEGEASEAEAGEQTEEGGEQ